MGHPNDPSTKVEFKIGGVGAETQWFSDALAARSWAEEHAPARWRLVDADGERDGWNGPGQEAV